VAFRRRLGVATRRRGARRASPAAAAAPVAVRLLREIVAGTRVRLVAVSLQRLLLEYSLVAR